MRTEPLCCSALQFLHFRMTTNVIGIKGVQAAENWLPLPHIALPLDRAYFTSLPSYYTGKQKSGMNMKQSRIFSAKGRDIKVMLRRNVILAGHSGFSGAERVGK
jgi:hypothetical protein